MCSDFVADKLLAKSPTDKEDSNPIKSSRGVNSANFLITADEIKRFSL